LAKIAESSDYNIGPCCWKSCLLSRFFYSPDENWAESRWKKISGENFFPPKVVFAQTLLILGNEGMLS
jgi:hypothetical protein